MTISDMEELANVSRNRNDVDPIGYRYVCASMRHGR